MPFIASPHPIAAAGRRRGLRAAPRARRGVSAVEYALILGLIACGLGVGAVQFGPTFDRALAPIERAFAAVLGGAAPRALSPAPPTGGPPGLPGPGASGTGGGAMGGGGGTSSF